MTDYPSTRTTLAANFENYVLRKFAEDFTDQLETDMFAQKANRIPTQNGDTIKFLKMLRLIRDVTALTASTQPDHKILYSMDITAQALEYGNRVRIERIPDLTAIALSFTDKAVSELANLAARQADYLVTTKLAANAYRVRADGDANFQKNVSTTSDGNAGGTTLIASGLIGLGDDYFNGGYVTIRDVDAARLSRESIYETRPITDFTSASGTITVSPAFSSIIKSTCKIHVCTGTGVVSTDVLSTDVFAKVLTRLVLNKARMFSGQPGELMPSARKGGSYWGVLIDAHINYEFMTDDTWTKLGIHQIAENLISGTGVKWMGCKIHGRTQAWREDVDGTENEDAGAVHLAHFLGQDAYGISDVASPGAKPPYGHVVTYQSAKDLGQSVLRYSEMGYNLYFCVYSLDSLSNVAVLCGAPEVG